MNLKFPFQADLQEIVMKGQLNCYVNAGDWRGDTGKEPKRGVNRLFLQPRSGNEADVLISGTRHMTSKEIRVACFENYPGSTRRRRNITPQSYHFHGLSKAFFSTERTIQIPARANLMKTIQSSKNAIIFSDGLHLVKKSIILFDLHTSKNFCEACMGTLHCQTCYVTWLNSVLLSCLNHSVFSHSLSNKYLKGLIQLTLRGKKFAMQLALATVASQTTQRQV